MKMSNRVYDILKYISMIFLPALVTLVLAVSEIWGIPYGSQIGATISAAAAALGAMLKTSADKYNGKN